MGVSDIEGEQSGLKMSLLTPGEEELGADHSILSHVFIEYCL